MLPTTLNAVRSVLATDLQINPHERHRLLSLLRGQPLEREPATSIGPPGHRLMRRREVAERLSVSLRTVDKYASMGILRKRILPNRKRASGFLASDVEALIMGQGGGYDK